MEETWPVPGVPPAPITYEQFLEMVPEKFELVDGYLFDPRIATVQESDCQFQLVK